MTKYELIDIIEEIQDKNDKFYTGRNEADLTTREDIADLIFKILYEKDQDSIEKMSIMKDALFNQINSLNDKIREKDVEIERLKKK
jgi:hypothetical protein